MLKNSNLLTLQNDLNSQTSCLNKWCNSNKLTINPQKCHILAISPKSNKNVTDFFIKLNGTVIRAENSVKYLGINLDLNLNFRKHIEVIENKLSRSLAILFKLKPVLPQNALLKLYYAMVHPYLIYGLVAWGSTFPSYIEKLNILQNKAVKLIGGGNYLDRATPYYSKLNILKLPDLYKLEVAKFVHRFMHNTLPQSFSNFFAKVGQVNTRTTRSSSNPNNLYIPCYKSNRIQQSIKYQGVKVWNSIPVEIQNLPKSRFKIKLKSHLMQAYLKEINWFYLEHLRLTGQLSTWLRPSNRLFYIKPLKSNPGGCSTRRPRRSLRSLPVSIRVPNLLVKSLTLFFVCFLTRVATNKLLLLLLLLLLLINDYASSEVLSYHC